MLGDKDTCNIFELCWIMFMLNFVQRGESKLKICILKGWQHWLTGAHYPTQIASTTTYLSTYCACRQNLVQMWRGSKNWWFDGGLGSQEAAGLWAGSLQPECVSRPTGRQVRTGTECGPNPSLGWNSVRIGRNFSKLYAVMPVGPLFADKLLAWLAGTQTSINLWNQNCSFSNEVNTPIL